MDIKQLFTNLAVVAGLILCLILLDWAFNIRGPFDTAYLCIIFISMIMLMSLFSLRYDSMHNRYAFILTFVFTAVADVLLIVMENDFGLIPFIFAQSFRLIYFLRMKPLYSILTLLGTALVITGVYFIPSDVLMKYSIFYAVLLVTDTVIAFVKGSGNKTADNARRWGMMLFCGCDICVMLFNIDPSLGNIWLPLIWLFYIPSQFALVSEILPWAGAVSGNKNEV